MSTRRRHNASHFPTSGSESAIRPLAGCAILLVICIAKCIYDRVRRNREVPVYESETTDSELSFEPYMPRRQRRERDQRPRRGSLDLTEHDLNGFQRQGWVGNGPIHIPTATPRGPHSRGSPRSRSRVGSRFDSRSTNGSTTGFSGGIECQICFEEKREVDFPSRSITDKCQHRATDCCNTCLAHAITTAFEGNMWDNIRCPICNAQLQFQDMAALAPKNIFERYDNFQLRRAIERELPNFRWCVNRHCTNGEEHADDPSPVIECSACGVLACAQHNVPWHRDETCSQYDRRIAARQARAEHKSEKAIKRVAKRCPGCQRFINKNGGCNHMTCLCGRQFCWTCLHDFPGHTGNCPRRLD